MNPSQEYYAHCATRDRKREVCAICGESTVSVFILTDLTTKQTRVTLLCRPCMAEHVTDHDGNLQLIRILCGDVVAGGGE
jgi:hypothetical protein